jgi:hypothetical protein
VNEWDRRKGHRNVLQEERNTKHEDVKKGRTYQVFEKLMLEDRGSIFVPSGYRPGYIWVEEANTIPSVISWHCTRGHRVEPQTKTPILPEQRYPQGRQAPGYDGGVALPYCVEL